MSIEMLTKVVPPPSAPVQTGTPAEWDAVCRTIGVQLPEELHTLSNVYGSGMFWLNPSVGVDNPFGPNYVEDLESISRLFSEAGKGNKREYPYPFYPTPGGLLSIGSDDFGTSFYWLTKGDPEQWPIVLKSRSDKYEVHAHPLTTFLALAFTKKLETKIWKTAFLKDRQGKKADPKKFEFFVMATKKRQPTSDIFALYEKNHRRAGFWIQADNYGSNTYLRVTTVNPDPKNPKVLADYYHNQKLMEKDKDFTVHVNMYYQVDTPEWYHPD